MRPLLPAAASAALGFALGLFSASAPRHAGLALSSLEGTLLGLAPALVLYALAAGLGERRVGFVLAVVLAALTSLLVGV